MIRDAIAQVVERKDLSSDAAGQVMREMMGGLATQSQIGSFLTAMRMKGETEDELRGFVLAMRESSSKIASPQGAVDMCGTGGDCANTFNISTVAAFVVAGAGVAVAKHGNRSVSSKCGSADLLAALGIPHDLPPEMVQECLGSCGLGFMFAPVFHSSMRNVIGPRREVGLRTFFNILGPMANPAGVKNQLIGVYDPALAVTMARVLRDLGSDRVLVVNGSGMDECTTTGKTTVVDLKDGAIEQYDIEPGMFGLDLADPRTMDGGDASANARIALSVLKGERGHRADVVALNAAAGLYVSGKAASIQEGLEIARSAISSGAAYAKAKQFAQVCWELEARRQCDVPVSSLFERRIHPETLKRRSEELTNHIASEAASTAAGRQMMDSLDPGLTKSPSVLSVIVLRRILSVMATGSPMHQAAKRSKSRLSQSLSSSNGIAVIGEYKSRSPTSSPPTVPPDPGAVAAAFSSAGVSGVSVVVEPEFFGGSFELFSTVRSSLRLPMLFKDFVVSDEQVDMADRLGADAVLLIAKALNAEALNRLVGRCLSKGMEPLVEIHDLVDLEKLSKSSRYDELRMVGVNSRDLRTLETDLAGLVRLRREIGDGKLAIAESGVSAVTDIAAISGFDAVLVGTAFMRADDLDSKTREFVSACRSVTR